MPMEHWKMGILVYIPWRIHGAGIIYANIKGYIDGIHVTIFLAYMDPMGIKIVLYKYIKIYHICIILYNIL